MSNGTKAADNIAWLLAHHYNFVGVDNTKYERVLPTNNIGSHFFANTSNSVRILIQYDPRELEKQD